MGPVTGRHWMPISLSELHHALGGEISRGEVHAPGPGHGPKDRSLSVKPSCENPDGFVLHSFANDDPLTCRDYVRGRLGLSDFRADQYHQPPPRDDEVIAEQVRDSGNQARALVVWEAALPLPGTPAETYLRTRLRGRAIPGIVVEADALRFHPRTPFRGPKGLHYLPCLIALFRDVLTGEPTGIHRVILTAAGADKDFEAARQLGRSSPKSSLGPVRGAAIMLTGADLNQPRLDLAEGFETGLSVVVAGDVPGMWVTSNIESFGGPLGLQKLRIWADHDLSGVGLRKARRCAEQLQQAGVAVQVLIPPQVDTDWNHWLLRSGA